MPAVECAPPSEFRNTLGRTVLPAIVSERRPDIDTPTHQPRESSGRSRPSPAGALLAGGALLAALGIGFVAFGRFIDDFKLSLVFQALWFAAVGGVALLLVRRSPGLRPLVVGTLAACAVVGALAFYWTTIRDERVDETVVTGVKDSDVATADSPASGAPKPDPAVNIERASGSFAGLAHPTSGTAAVIDLAEGGRRLTLTDFETDNGPDLFVYVVPGSSNAEGSVDRGVSLGRLKGNIGTQQYDVPAGLDVAGGASIVIWCRAFTVAFGVAQLNAS